MVRGEGLVEIGPVEAKPSKGFSPTPPLPTFTAARTIRKLHPLSLVGYRFEALHRLPEQPALRCWSRTSDAGTAFFRIRKQLPRVDVGPRIDLIHLRVPSSSPSVSLRFRDLYGQVSALACAQGAAQQFLNFLPLPQGQ